MTVTQFNNICKDLVEAAGIKGHVLVAQEDHATNKLKDRSGIWLVAVIPTTEIEGEPDAEKESLVSLLFVLESANYGQSDDDELKQFQRTQDAILKIKDHITEMQSIGCSPFANYDPSQTVINPEYQIFSDRNGWSMTLIF